MANQLETLRRKATGLKTSVHDRRVATKNWHCLATSYIEVAFVLGPREEAREMNSRSNKISSKTKSSYLRCVEGVIAQRSLKTVYQPIVYHSENVVFACEVLSRPWFRGTFIPPEDWFLAAFECNRSVEADLCALASGIGELGSLPPLSTPLSLFVNVMPSSLIQMDFLKGLELSLKDAQFDPEKLVFEIIENGSYDITTLFDHVQQLRSFGIRIALDDVGLGSASLQALVGLDPDFIKVDRTLIHGIASSERKQRLLSLLVQFMRTGDVIIAEGIENFEDLLAVKEAGVGLSQGYYWGHPMPSEELSLLLAQIDMKRNELVDRVSEKFGSFTDSSVLQISEELDYLISRYYSLNKDP